MEDEENINEEDVITLKDMKERFKSKRGVLSGKPLKRWRVISGVIALLFSILLFGYIFYNWDEMTQTIMIYPDGCEEVYEFHPFVREYKLITPECTLGREYVEANNLEMTIVERDFQI